MSKTFNTWLSIEFAIISFSPPPLPLSHAVFLVFTWDTISPTTLLPLFRIKDKTEALAIWNEKTQCREKEGNSGTKSREQKDLPYSPKWLILQVTCGCLLGQAVGDDIVGHCVPNIVRVSDLQVSHHCKLTTSCKCHSP